MELVLSIRLVLREIGALRKPWHTLVAKSEHLIQQLMESKNPQAI